MATQSAPILICREMRKLLRQFSSAASEYHRLQSAQFVAMLNGKGSLFDDWVEKAAAQKHRAKYAMAAHRHEHG